LQAAFANCESFNGDLSLWNTTSVTSLYGTFAYINTDSFTGDSIANWDTSKVFDLRYAFYESSFDPANLHGWNIESVSSRAFFDSFFSNRDLTECERYKLFNAWSHQSSDFRDGYLSWGSTNRECACQIGS
jgi:surface protein